MNISIVPTETGITIKASLTLVDKDHEGEVTLTGESRIGHGDILSILTDPSVSRQAAVNIVGRLLTQWKFSLINNIGEAVVTATQEYLAGQARGGQTAPEQ